MLQDLKKKKYFFKFKIFIPMKEIINYIDH